MSKNNYQKYYENEFYSILEKSMRTALSFRTIFQIFYKLIKKDIIAGSWYILYQLCYKISGRGDVFRKKFRKAWHPDIFKYSGLGNIQRIFFRKSKPLINVLTRTSGRPNAFKMCRDSIENQTYSNIRHIVSFDDKQDLNYILNFDVDMVDVSCLKNENTEELKSYNLYCNQLLKSVSSGWVLFLDDDNILKEKNTLEILVSQIKFIDEDTLIVFQTEFPDNSRIPQSYYFKRRNIEKYQIDTGCVLIHSKYASLVQWDNKRMADYRFIKRISEIIPKQKWIELAMTKKLNFGDSGNRNDILKT